MRRGRDAAEFARRHGFPFVTVADIVRYRYETERLVEAGASTRMPTSSGDFRAVAYRSVVDGNEHLALVTGDLRAAESSSRGVLVRVHSECLTGDILGSMRCDCGDQLKQASELITQEACGVLVYLRGHEGRGTGLAHKLRAYGLQDEFGLDTVETNTVQGLPVDGRRYEIGAQILADLGISRVRLITNSPAKSDGLARCGIDVVDRVAVPANASGHNVRYLMAKRDRVGHDLDIKTG